MEFLKQYTKMIMSGIGFVAVSVFWLIVEGKLSDAIITKFNSLGLWRLFVAVALNVRRQLRLENPA
jgi:hypothetical protein